MSYTFQILKEGYYKYIFKPPCPTVDHGKPKDRRKSVWV
jgi:hypothetical protein